MRPRDGLTVTDLPGELQEAQLADRHIAEIDLGSELKCASLVHSSD
jgi:hypothetical protein